MRIGRLGVRALAVAALVLGLVAMHHLVRSDDDGSAIHQSHSAATTVAMERPGAAAHGPVPATAGHDASGRSGTGDDAPPAAVHDLVHLCLAVLTTALLIPAVRLLSARRPSPTRRRNSAPTTDGRAPKRPPPRPAGSTLLVSLCVLRT